MNSYQIDYPVRDVAGQFFGVLTRPRLVDALRTYEPERIVGAMTPAASVPRCTPDSDLASVWETMGRTGSRVVAAATQGQVPGIITSDDIAEVFQVMGAALEVGRHPPAPPADHTETQEMHGYV
jgi:hypothetical protein